MAVARLVSIFENKPLDTRSPTTLSSAFQRPPSSSPSLAPSSPASDVFHISIQPYHFSQYHSARNRYYYSTHPATSPSSSTSSSPKSSFRNGRFRSPSPSSSPSSPRTPLSYTQHLKLRRQPSHVDLAIVSERDEIGLDLLEPRPVRQAGLDCMSPSSAEPLVVLEGIFEVLESGELSW